MAMLIDGNSIPLRRVMREGLHRGFNSRQMQEFRRQLSDAARNSYRPLRRKEYAEYLLKLDEEKKANDRAAREGSV